MKPVAYWRQSKDWANWIGKTGTVVASTQIRVTSPELSEFAPYSFVLVDFGDQRRELMAASGESISAGDDVVCVLRKMATPDATGIIHYGIKVSKVIAQ